MIRAGLIAVLACGAAEASTVDPCAVWCFSALDGAVVGFATPEGDGPQPKAPPVDVTAPADPLAMRRVEREPHPLWACPAHRRAFGTICMAPGYPPIEGPRDAAAQVPLPGAAGLLAAALAAIGIAGARRASASRSGVGSRLSLPPAGAFGRFLPKLPRRYGVGGLFRGR